MRKIAFLLMLTLFSFWTPIAAQDTPSHLPFAKGFLESLQSSDFARLQGLTPTMPVWRVIAPEKDKKLSDEELRKKIDSLVTVKLRKDFDNIVKDAKAKGIDLSQIKFSEAILDDGVRKSHTPRALTVFYIYNGKKSSFALSVTEVDGKYYLLEILRSYGVVGQ
jgi:hypothetical protein